MAYKTLNENLSIKDNIRARHTRIINELTLSISDMSEYVRGKYYTEVINISSVFLLNSRILLNELISIGDNVTKTFFKVINHVIAIKDSITKKFMTIKNEIVNVIANGGNKQYLAFKDNISVISAESVNWYRECAELIKIVPNLIFNATRLTFTEVLKIKEFLRTRIDILTLVENINIKANAFIRTSGMTFVENIKVIDSVVRGAFRTLLDNIHVIGENTKKSIVALKEKIEVSEYMWWIKNHMASIQLVERVILSASSYTFQAFISLKEFISIKAKETTGYLESFAERLEIDGYIEDLVKGVGLRETFTIIDNIGRNIFKALKETILVHTNVARSEILTETIQIRDTIINNALLIFREVIAISDSIIRKVSIVLKDTISVIANVYKMFIKTVSENVEIVAKFEKKAFKMLIEKIKVLPLISVLFNNEITTGLWSRKAKNMGEWHRKKGDWK